MEYGYWAVVPPLIAIGAAIITRQVLLSLGLGTLVAAGIYTVFSEASLFTIPIVFVDWLVTAIIDPGSGHALVLVFTLLLGALIALLQRSGGSKGFARWALGFANTPRRALIVGWFLGLLVFIDDYFDTITVGTVMRPVTDRNNVSREKLAYLVDTTAAPVAVMAPVSTWVGVILSEIAKQDAVLVYSSFETFLRSVPFNFYSILAMGLALYLILARVEFGPMAAAERRAATTGALLRPGATPLQSKELDAFGDESEAEPKLVNLVMPLVALVLTAIVAMYGTGYVGASRAGAGTELFTVLEFVDPFASLVYASLAALLYCGIFYGIQRIITLKEYFEAIEVGFKAMLPACMVLVMAWTIGYAIEVLELGATMANVVEQNIPLWLVPPLVFVLAGFTALATGTSFGTFIIMLAIAIPTAASIDPGMIPLLIAATLGGAVFGDHASPISDTTVLSSTASACDHVDHVRTQLPYAGLAAGIAILGYTGYGIAQSLGATAAVAGATAWVTVVVVAVVAGVVLRLLFRVPDQHLAERPGPSKPVPVPADE